MQTIYPNLAIGNHVDMHVALYVQSTFAVVLDVTSELSTRKWNRNGVTIRKVGFAKAKAMQPAKIKKALDFIQEHRSQNHSVLVGCDDGSRSKLIGILYLVANKGYSFEEATQMAGGIDGIATDMLESAVKFCDKICNKEEVVVGG